MRYVLVIPGWFPSEVNFLAGDFIERHAKAAALFFPVKVLYVVKDKTLPFGRYRLGHQKLNGQYESFTWYYSSGSKSGFIEKIVSACMQSFCLFKGFRKIVRQNGLPSLIHAHVLLKHAWFALYQSKKHSIPLLASEQWTGYLQEAKGEFESLTYFQRYFLGKVFRHAVHVTTVSDYLARSIKKRFHFNNYTVIPNLVNTSVFTPAATKNESRTAFIHISTLSEQKNADEIIDACGILRSLNPDFLLRIVAPSNNAFYQEVQESNLGDHIVFCKEVPQQELARLIAGSDALILYSNYETFGCVIVEANACGVPVIVSDFKVFDENVREGITGFKVPLHQPQSLAECMLKFINKTHTFDKNEVVSITKQEYSFEVVGKQFAAVYDRFAKP